MYKTVDEKNFMQPDMGDYYDEELMAELLENVEPGNAKNAAYYVEEPFTTTLGYHANYSAFVLKATPVIKTYDDTYKTSQGERNETINAIDADTIPFYLDSVEDGDMPFEINGEQYNNFRHYAKNKMDFGSFKTKIFKIRTVGINAPEVPHLEITPVPIKDLENKKVIRYFPVDAIGKRDDLVYLVNRERTLKEYQFIYNEKSKTWHEVVVTHETYPFKYEDPKRPGVKYFTTVTADEQSSLDMDGDTNLGLYATDVALELLNKAEDIRIVLDAKQLYTSANYSTTYSILREGWTKDNTLWELTKAMWHRAFGDGIYKYSGFGTFGQDAYRRFLGAVYVKTSIDGNKTVWINLAKYVRSKVGEAVKLMPGVSPETQANGNGLSDAFKVWSYDNRTSVIADGFYNISKADFDDRRAIQKEITGLDFATYRDYTVMIGDCLFMVPPTSIRVVNQINSNRVPVLRSKGTAVKELPHNDRLIEMTLYFNGEEGINGIPIEKQLPRQIGTEEKTTYYMNGLRSLISMFKFTPFMPIENEYINDVLGIEAVSLANIQIQTMPMYPKCLAVSLTLQQFNYRIYLNELPLPEPEEGQDYNTNMFARTINYEVMRYYYQKSIIAGEELRNIPANSQDFIERTMGHSTALIPMNFKDQTINFMILDSDWLDKMKKVKELASKQPINQTAALNDATRKWASQVGVTLGKVLDLFKGGIITKPEQGLLDSIINKDTELCGRDELKSILATNLLKNNSSPLLSSVSLMQTLTNLNEENCILEFSLLSLSSNEISNLMKKVMKELNTKELSEESQQTLYNGQFKLKLVKNESKDEIVWTLDTSTEEYKIAEFFAFRSGYGLDDVEVSYDEWDMFATSSNEETFEAIKEEALDTETLLSAKFIDYPIENLIVQNFSITMGNILSNTKLKSQDGYAPQYAGGQDTIIEFTMHTMDKEVVTALNAMQEMAAQQLIRYSSIIKCWPIRIVSEMTKLCGIHEVIIDSIDISTVPMQPGLFAINCRAISVDRTIRNKEALQRLDSINNAGSTNPNSVASWIEKTYFDLNNTLAQAEVYPDLELPTIEELDQAGFKFIRYMKKDSCRVYPDPDFYFVYGYVYSAQMLRKSIVDYFEQNSETGKTAIENISRTYFGTDSQQEYNVKYNSEEKNKVLKYNAVNKHLEKQYFEEKEERAQKVLEARKQEGEDIDENSRTMKAMESLYLKTKPFEDELSAMNLKAWDVCSNIKCVLPDHIPVNAKSAIEEFDKVTEDIIDIIDDYLSKPIDASKHKISVTMRSCLNNYATYHDKSVYPDIKKVVNLLFNEKKDGVWKKLLDTLNINTNSSNVRKIILGIFEAAAMAMSGNSEYSPNNKQENYCARAFFSSSNASVTEGTTYNYPFSRMVDEKTGEDFYATTTEMAVEQGITFGVYQIRKYNKDFLQAFYEDEAVSFNDMDFLDPYYNQALHKKKFNEDIDTREYKTKLIESNSYSVEAFNRIVLVWVKKLLQDKNYISYYDIRRDNINETLESLLQENAVQKVVVKRGTEYVEEVVDQSADQEQIKDYEKTKEYVLNIKDVVDSYEDNLIAGKIFLPVVCAVIHGDSAIYDKISSKNTGALNAKTRSCQMSLDSANDITEGDRNFRKLIRGLAATKEKVIAEIDGIASEQPTKLENALIERNERLWIEASEDPSLWVMHSFYDMIVNDKRGRMARAFPTYYMLLIDEGREIGYWKLHDNFYNMSSISEIEVTKSRKMPADTARIVMTNLYKTFSTEDEDIKVDYEHNIKDVFTSIFSPSVYFEKEETKRTNQLNINRAVIKPGVRIHLRMGYSADASSLPILFNGVVAEASTGELIELIAQGDGHEIANDQAFATASTKDLSDLKHEDSFFAAKWIKNFLDEGATPKTLIKNMLTTKSGWLGRQANAFTNGRFFNDNMFGITHFGEIDYKHIHSDGEVMQNIYEAEGRMPWQDNPTVGSLAEECADISVPTFTIDITNKSVWDVLHICASSSLEFVTGVSPFGLRSTIFFGRPHYYYAYDYAINDNGIIVEKRKPYQQYHIIDSYSDIIGNSIIANGTNVKTVAVPMYKGPNYYNKTVEKKGVTLFADWDIYPEYQKTMIVNTGMTWKGNKLGSIVVNSFKDKVSKDGGSKIAWRMAATALKNSFKDMYEGEVIIIGDPSIKPIDKVFLYDTYENMDGAFEVEAVVQRLSPETGFTTSVYPDCITTVDSRYEEIGQMWSKQVLGQVVVTKMAIHAGNMLFGTTTKPMLNTIAKLTSKGVDVTANTLRAAANLIGQEHLAKYCTTEKWTQSFFNALNISSDEVSLWNTIDKLKHFTNISSTAGATTINSSKDLMNQVKKIIDASEGASVDDVVKTLQTAIDNGSVKASDIDKVADSIKEIQKLGEKLDNTKINSLMKSLIDDSVSQLKALSKAGKLDDAGQEALNILTDLKKMDKLDIKSAKKAAEAMDKVADVLELTADAKAAGTAIIKHSDDAAKVISKVNKLISNKNLSSSIKTIGKLAGGTAVAASIATFAFEAALMYVLEKTVYNWIENLMSSFNVLTVYPLRKNGTAHVAGIDGHKGLVVGSATWNKEGPIGNFINWAFKDRDSIIYNWFVKGLLYSDEMIKIAETYKKDNSLGNYANTMETSISGLLESIAESQASNYSNYRSMVFSERITSAKSAEAQYTYKKTRIVEDTLEDIATNNVIRDELVPITADNIVLEPYFNTQILKLAHDQSLADADKIPSYSFDNISAVNGKVETFGIKLTDTTVDLPFLRPDAFQLFYKIVEHIVNKANMRKYGEGDNITVWFKSGTIVNDNSWASTGYMFRFEVTNFSNEEIEATMSDLAEEIQEIFSNSEIKQTYNIFNYRQINNSNAYEVFVSPRNEYIKLQLD